MTEILTRLTESEAIALVKQLAYVEVHPATDLIPGLILDAGEVIGYLDHPSLTIRHEDGTTKTWSAKLPMRVTDRPTSSATPQHENVTVTLAELRTEVATLTAQRDRARTLAVTLEQELAKARTDNHEDRVRYIDNTMRTGQDVESLWDLLGQAASALHLYVAGQSWPDQEDARAKAERVLAQVSERAVELR